MFLKFHIHILDMSLCGCFIPEKGIIFSKSVRELLRNYKTSRVSDLLFAIAEYSGKVACLICNIFEVMIKFPDSRR